MALGPKQKHAHISGTKTNKNLRHEDESSLVLPDPRGAFERDRRRGRTTPQGWWSVNLGGGSSPFPGLSPPRFRGLHGLTSSCSPRLSRRSFSASPFRRAQMYNVLASRSPVRPPMGLSRASEAPTGSSPLLATGCPRTLGAFGRNHANRLSDIISLRLRGIEEVDKLRQLDSSVWNERVAR